MRGLADAVRVPLPRCLPARALLLALAMALAAPALSSQARAVPHPSIALLAEPDYGAARARIKARDYAAALPLLLELEKHCAGEAEVHSLIGFSMRKLGRFDEALERYRRALALDPNHLGANEYLGELYVETGRLDLARERLAILQRLCGVDCEEAKDLEEAIAGGPAGAKAKNP